MSRISPVKEETIQTVAPTKLRLIPDELHPGPITQPPPGTTGLHLPESHTIVHHQIGHTQGSGAAHNSIAVHQCVAPCALQCVVFLSAISCSAMTEIKLTFVWHKLEIWRARLIYKQQEIYCYRLLLPLVKQFRKTKQMNAVFMRWT